MLSIAILDLGEDMTRDLGAERHQPDHLPPPIGVHHELPQTTTEALKQVIEQDPDYARWVLFRSEEFMTILDDWYASGLDPRDTDVKEKLAALLLEGRELELAIKQNQELARLFEVPGESET
jgi:hypothetical protein